MSISEIKRLARDEARARRRQAHAEIGEAASDAVANLLSEWLRGMDGKRCVAATWPIGSELDLRPALARLARDGHTTALPTTLGDGTLIFHAWEVGDPLNPGPHGTMEPAGDAPPVRPDIVLVPGIAFDHDGGRLGQGGGFYDKTLAALRDTVPSIMAIGVAFSSQLVKEVPLEPHDQRVDHVLTEKGFLKHGPALIFTPQP